MRENAVDHVQRRTLATLVVTQVLGGIGLSAGVAVGALLAEDIAGSATYAGLGGTFQVLGTALLAIPMTSLIAARGRRSGLALGYAAAFLGAMLMLFLPSVRGVVNDNATEIGLLLLLGLGTFVAGVHAGSWRIIAVGAVLGASVPAVAMLQQSAMLIAGGVAVAALIGVVFVFARMRG